jgi:CubicO group peptidase (beta-lactamase class C family)
MKRQATSPIVLTLLLLLIAPVAALADKVDDLVKAEMQRQRITGVSVAVVKEGKIIKAGGYGLANAELNIPATPESVYQIGSVSKQLIAAGILILVQDGKLSVDDKISKYLEGTPETWKDITVRHLLTHTSGIQREAPGFNPQRVQADADVIKTAYPLPLRFAPGEKWEYSNTGYFTLAEIIRTVSGEPWPSFLNTRLFQPLDMKATRTTTASEIVANRANGYVFRDGKLRNADIYLALRPSGAFLSSVLDLAKWDAALYADRPLTVTTREQMWTPGKLNSGASHTYGFGWEVDTIGGHKRVSHSGSLTGFRATISRYLDDKLTVIVLTNSGLADPDTIALNVADAYISGLLPQRTISKVDPRVLDGYLGQYQPNPAVTLTISRDGEKLLLQPSVSPDKQELLPEAANSFFTTVNRQLTYSFAKDDTGQVTHLVISNAGREVGRIPKIK